MAWRTASGVVVNGGDYIEYSDASGRRGGTMFGYVNKLLTFHDHVIVNVGNNGTYVDDRNFVRVVKRARGGGRRDNPLRQVDAHKVGGLTNWRWRSKNGVGWITVENDRDSEDYHAVYQFFDPRKVAGSAGFNEGAKKYHACLDRSDCKTEAERAGYAAASRAFNSGEGKGRSFGLRLEQHFTSLKKARAWVVEQSKRHFI